MIKIPLQDRKNGCRPAIEYPCSWQYKIIGESRSAIEETVTAALTERSYTLEDSKVSRTGRYVSLNLELTVLDEAERLGLYRTLAASPHIKVVL
jgi:hypothetical protein